MPSPLTGAIVVSLLIFAGFMQTWGKEKFFVERSSRRCGARSLIAQVCRQQQQQRQQ